MCKWVKKSRVYGYHPIPTKSSKPKHHPKELPRTVVDAIVHKRLEHNRCAEVIHAEISREGITTSLSSVKRTLERAHLIKKRSPWKRFHPHVDRPHALKPGDLVELDTIHLMTGKKSRMYVFTLIDTYSRWVHAKAYAKMNGATSVRFLAEAQKVAPFRFDMLQSDHGPEFSSWFVENAKRLHRYSRIGKPNDNAHIERFNRTLQEECLDGLRRDPQTINRALNKYLQYYNEERVHLGISLRSPIQLITKCVQGID